MSIGRRELLRLLGAGVSGAALWGVNARLVEAVIGGVRQPKLVWLRGLGTDISLLSQLGMQHPNFLDLVRLEWVLDGGDVFSGVSGSWSFDRLGERLILVLEGVPSELDFRSELWSNLLSRGQAAILLGTDVCYGGVGESLGSLRLLEKQLGDAGVAVVKLPGVPPPPQHLTGILAYMQEVGFPRLDGHQRPLLYYGRTVCEDCERQGDLQRGRFASYGGDEGCLLRLGCKGLVTHNSCARQRWNGGEQWCVGVGGACTGCSEPSFPNHGGLGLSGAITAGLGGSRWWRSLGWSGWGLTGLAGLAWGLEGLRGWLFSTKEKGLD